MALATAVPAAAADPVPADLAPAERAQAARLLEYEGLLGEPIAAEIALCIDDQLAGRWPRADEPSPRQWQRMQDQARQAHEQCVGPVSETDRAAGVIRRAMAMQVARQQAMAAYIGQLRACAAVPPSKSPAAACQALRRPGAPTTAGLARIAHAHELGRR